MPAPDKQPRYGGVTEDLRRRIGSDRYRRELEQVRSGELGTSFTSDQQIGWSDYRLDKEFREAPADQTVADLFGVAPGTMLLERRFVFRSQGVPQQMSTSFLLLDMVAGTTPAIEWSRWPPSVIPADRVGLGYWIDVS